MTPKQFNGIYRPLVKSAWESYCIRSGFSPNAKDAYRMWYEQHIREATKGRIFSTKDATDRERRHLVDYFRQMLSPSGTVQLLTWTESQVARFNDLAKDAHRTERADGETRAFIPYIEAILHRHHVPQDDGGRWHLPNRKESFDKIMADLAIRANDEYWIKRTAEQSEIRMRYQITRFLVDLDYLDKRFEHKWDYVVGIYKQSAILPSDIMDCPAEILWRVMAMLDTHVRRICKDFGVRPMDLPTRQHPHAHLKINEQAHHLHVGHELEHIPETITVSVDDPEVLDPIPF